MHTVAVVRSIKRLNSGSDSLLARIKSINKIKNVHERYNKRTKQNSEDLEDTILSQKFLYMV
jgi:hypothetical protein